MNSAKLITQKRKCSDEDFCSKCEHIHMELLTRLLVMRALNNGRTLTNNGLNSLRKTIKTHKIHHFVPGKYFAMVESFENRQKFILVVVPYKTNTLFFYKRDICEHTETQKPLKTNIKHIASVKVLRLKILHV